jgi:hypothetical protein
MGKFVLNQLPPPEGVACFELHLEGARGSNLKGDFTPLDVFNNGKKA